MTKVIFIDWNKTLSYSLFWEQLKDPHHPNHTYLETIERWLFVDNRHKINPWMKGEITTNHIVTDMERDTKIKKSLILKELKYSCETMTYSVKGVDTIISRIRKKGIKVVVATDNMDTFSRYTAPALKLAEVFDGVLNSHTLGHLKDDPLPRNSIPFFDSYLHTEKLHYEDAVLLDDSPDSSGKYKKLGFNRITIDSPETLKEVLERYAE